MSDTESSHDAPPRAAAIVDDGSCDVDALLAAVAQQQRGTGRRVRGVVMTHPDAGLGCAGRMVLVDLHTRDEYLVSQSLGAASNSCRVDPQGFARASQVLRQAVDDAPDLVISNRFGGLEAGGGGFCAELLELMARGVPLLTTVAPRHVDAWTAFTGGATLLPAQGDALQRWLADALERRAA